MILFPAVDLLGGQAVRLYQGDYQQKTVYQQDPLEAVERFVEAGATHLHLVDLDGARTGQGVNRQVISRIAQLGKLFIQVGGGIRDMKSAEDCLNRGAHRVILGTAAAEDPAFLRQAILALGNSVAVGMDIRQGRVATRGWTRQSSLTPETFLDQLAQAGVTTLIVTDISRDGAMAGANLSLYEELQSQGRFQLVASGGVSSLADVKALRAMNLYGAIIGKALYTGAVDLKQALEASL